MTARMHIDELELDEALVRRLLAEQFPAWVELPLRRIEPAGTDNAIFRLGDGLSVRLARRAGPTEPGGKERDWLPRLRDARRSAAAGESRGRAGGTPRTVASAE